MVEKLYIAEFHDIAKLLDKDRLKRLGFEVKGQRFDRTNFESLGLTKPNCPSWYAPYSDDMNDLASKRANECGAWAGKVFLTRIADEIASSFRLIEGEKTGTLEGYRKIWKEAAESAHWQENLVADINALSSLLDHWGRATSGHEFLERYNTVLCKLPEDKTVPYNITSLQNHLMLVGKLFRALDAATTWDRNTKLMQLGKVAVSQIEQATGSRIDETPRRGNWVGTLALIRVDFPQTLVRLADLNVVVARQRAISATQRKFPDHVLYSTPDSFLAFLPEGGPVALEQLLAPILKGGFEVEMKMLTAELGLLASDFDRQYGKFHSQGLAPKRTLRLVERPFSPEGRLPQEIRGKLCEVCQIRPSQSSPWFKDQIEEWLCDTCSRIRKMHEPATDIAAWTGAVMWVKVSLDRNNLLGVLPDLFRRYVRDVFFDATDNEIREFQDRLRPLTLEVDFVQDYLEFAKRFQDRVIGRLTQTDPGFTPVPWTYTLDGYSELIVCPVVSNQEFLVVCRCFIDLMREMFPRCVANSVITLGLSLSRAKNPYQDHWRLLNEHNNLAGPISIQRANDLCLRLTIPQFEVLDSLFSHADAPTSGALHRLAAIERTSQSTSAALFEGFRDSRLRPLLRNLLFEHQLPIESVLNFYKLTVWQEEHRAAHARIL